jgi:hypothetical protein
LKRFLSTSTHVHAQSADDVAIVLAALLLQCGRSGAGATIRPYIAKFRFRCWQLPLRLQEF